MRSAFAAACAVVVLVAIVAAGRGTGETAVLAADRELKMVVIGAGRTGGVRPGMTYVIRRGAGEVAGVRVIDVRQRISGAVITRMTGGMFPKRGDEAVPAAETE